MVPKFIGHMGDVLGQLGTGDGKVLSRSRLEDRGLTDEAEGSGVAAVIVGPSYDTPTPLTPRHRA